MNGTLDQFDTGTLLSALGARESAIGGFGPPATGSVPDAIRLLGGVPAEEALPTAQLARAYREVLEDRAESAAALQYSVVNGIEPLRSWIGARENVDPARVLVTGALHGLSLLFSPDLRCGSHRPKLGAFVELRATGPVVEFGSSVAAFGDRGGRIEGIHDRFDEDQCVIGCGEGVVQVRWSLCDE